MKKGTFDENVGHFFQHMLMENLIALKCTKSNDKYRKFHFNQERTDVINWILNKGEYQVTFEECCYHSGVDAKKLRSGLEAKRII